MKPLTLFLCLAFIAASTGCSTLKPSLPKWLPVVNAEGDGNESPLETEPASVAVLWKDSVYEKPGSPSVRGFGGRVFLYDANNEPVRADGELIVYGYDESNSSQSDGGADKKFVFPSKQFQQHYSKSDLGHSYSVWVPWEKIGGMRKSITLIPVFKTADGKVLRSGQSINTLPGKKPAKRANEITEVDHADGSSITRSANIVAQASFDRPTKNLLTPKAESDQASTEAKRAGMRTTTLNLPPSLAKKMAGSSLTTPPSQASASSLAKVSPAAKPTLNATTAENADSAPAESNKTKARIFGVPGAF